MPDERQHSRQYRKHGHYSSRLADNHQAQADGPMKGIVCALASGVLIAYLALPVSADQISGEARVVDGDTIAFGKVRVRMFGIDAPEVGRAGAAEATAHLRSLIKGAVACDVVDTDRYKRPVALCRSGGIDLSEAMLRSCTVKLLDKWFRVVPETVRKRLRAAASGC